jgi:hypothetical protein
MIFHPLPLVFNPVYYPRLEIAIIVIPSIRTAIAGATVPPLAPAKNIHTAKAIQMIPTMNLSFLTCPSFDAKYEVAGSHPPAATYFHRHEY